MRKENSDFVTDFITSPGDFKENRDYFAFVELDDLACWVLADGLDSAQDVLSAKLAAGSVISDFTEDPSLKRRDLKRYLRDANQFLRRESRMMSLKASLVVVVSDYKSLAWGSIGNTRLYHLRKETINFRSKDNSVAQMMVEVGDITQQKLNQHEERNNLTEYLGKEERIKPNIHRKRKLEDDDVLLMCTSGFWENIDDKEIETVLKDSKEAKEFVENLEQKLLSKDNDNLDNYSIASVFINKVFQQDVNSNRFPVKKVAMFLIPICILIGGMLTYGQMKQQAAKLEQQKKQQAKLKQSTQAKQKADKLFKQQKYQQALSKYQQARKSYKTLNKEEKLAAVQERIKATNKMITGQKLEQTGDSKFKQGNYEQALTNYKKAKLTYLKVDEYNLHKIEDKISRTENILKATSYALEGNMLVKSADYSVAKEKYLVALEIYKENGLTAKEKEMKSKINKLDKKLKNKQKISRAKEIEAQGDKLLQQGKHGQANLKYMEAKVIYSELGKAQQVSEVVTKINKLTNQKLAKEAQKYKEIAYNHFKKGKYEKALLNYKQAREIFAKSNRTDEKAAVEAQIEKVKTQQAISKAKQYEKLAQQQLDKQNYQQAVSKYKQAKQVYAEKNLTTAQSKINSKLDKVQYMQSVKKASDYEQLADQQVKKEKYDKALDNYKQAEKIYSRIDDQEAYKQVKQKIKETKDKKEKISFFF